MGSAQWGAMSPATPSAAALSTHLSPAVGVHPLNTHTHDSSFAPPPLSFARPATPNTHTPAAKHLHPTHNMGKHTIVGAGNPLLDISANVGMDLAEKCVLRCGGGGGGRGRRR